MKAKFSIGLFLALVTVIVLTACGGTPAYARYDSYGGYCRDSFGVWTICPGYVYDPVLDVVYNVHTGQPVYVSSSHRSQVYSGSYASGAPNPNTLKPKGSVSVSQVKSSSGYQSAVTTQSNKSGGQTITTSGGGSSSNPNSSNPNTSGGQTISTGGSSKPSTNPNAGSCSGQNNCTGGGNATTNKSGGSGPAPSTGGASNPNRPSSGGASNPNNPNKH